MLKIGTVGKVKVKVKIVTLEVQVLDMSKKVLGAEHPDTIMSMENLARIYFDQGNLKEAEDLEI